MLLLSIWLIQRDSMVHSVVVYDLNELNVFVITGFFAAVIIAVLLLLLLLLLNPSAYDKLLGASLCISQVLLCLFLFVLIHVL